MSKMSQFLEDSPAVPIVRTTVNWRRTAMGVGLASAVAVELALAAAGRSHRPDGDTRAASVRAPELSLDRAQHDFGMVCPSEKTETVFQIGNSGAAELRIEFLDKSCGCTKPELGSNAVAPGGATHLKVTFSAPDYPGIVSHWVKLRTNDATRPIVQLDLAGAVRWPVDVVPSSVNLGLLLPGQTVSRTVELFNTDGLRLEINRATASQAWLTIDELPISGDWRRQFQLTALAPEQVGAFVERVDFATNSAKRPTITVDVHGEVVTSQKASPPRLLLGSHPARSEVRAVLVIQSASQANNNAVEEVKITDAGWDIADWETKRLNVKSVLLTMHIKVPEDAGYQRSTVVVHGPPNAPALEVPIGCLVQ